MSAKNPKLTPAILASWRQLYANAKAIDAQIDNGGHWPSIWMGWAISKNFTPEEAAKAYNTELIDMGLF